jgi:exonuclease III
MKILFWNIRGLGSAGRRILLIELVNKHSFDCICLQETIKVNFKRRELERFTGQKDMFWLWLPCTGHSGGLLMGIDKELATVIDEDQGNFFRAALYP